MNKFLLLATVFYVSSAIANHFGISAWLWFPVGGLGLSLAMSASGVYVDFDAHIKKFIRNEVLEVIAEEKDRLSTGDR